MIRPFTCICMLLAAGSGLYLYQSKHQALMLDRNINKVLNSVDAARQRTGLLRAEYALLNDPSRLSDLSTQLLPGLKTTAPGQFTTMADLDKRLPPVGLPPEPAAAPLETDAAPVASADPAPPPATPDPAPAVVADVVKPVAPSVEAPRIETARIDPPHQEPARVETARNDTIHGEVARTDAPRPDQAARPAVIAALPPRPAPQQVAVASPARLPASTQRVASVGASTMQPTSLRPPPLLPPTPVVARVTVPPRPAVTPAVARVTPQRQIRTQLPPTTPPTVMNGGIAQVGQIEPRPRMVGSALGMAREMVVVNPSPVASAYPAYAYPTAGYGYGR
ncbi:MAG TPA: hypothetical protein VGH36_11270 [Acetobacteraceae bacterium]